MSASLRDALIERWFDPENTEPESVTDAQILARLEDLVGEGWYHAGKETERVDYVRSLLASAFSCFLSIGSIHNTVEVRVARELHDEIRAVVGAPTAVGSDG